MRHPKFATRNIAALEGRGFVATNTQSLGCETRRLLEGTLLQPAAIFRRNDLKGKFSVQVRLLSGL